MDEYELIGENLWDIDPATSIYRVANVDYLISDIQSKVLTLPRVIGWDDTHEAAFFTRSVPLPTSEKLGLSGLATEWFGQCWSIQPESDAMWRIYNKDSNAVRIMTSAGDLLRTAFISAVAKRPSFREWARLSMFVGKVAYHDATSFRDLMMTPVQQVLESSSKQIARMLMQKRDPFAHENEVRFLYQSLRGGHYDAAGLDDSKLCLPQVLDYTIDGKITRMPKFLQLPFDWQILTGAMIGPRIGENVAQDMETKLHAAAPWLALSRSELYGPPDYAGQY